MSYVEDTFSSRCPGPLALTTVSVPILCFSVDVATETM